MAVTVLFEAGIRGCVVGGLHWAGKYISAKELSGKISALDHSVKDTSQALADTPPPHSTLFLEPAAFAFAFAFAFSLCCSHTHIEKERENLTPLIQSRGPL